MGDAASRNGVDEKVSTGIAGLDYVLDGGFLKDRLHLLEGSPGTGKTTAALQFLLAGAAQGERVLYVALSETADELRSVARSHGWSLDGVAIEEVVPGEESLRSEEQYTIFPPSEVELGRTVEAVLEEVEATKPTRVAIDSLAELRLLARDPIRSRRQVLALKQFFAGRRSTVLVLDNVGDRETESVASIAHSVIKLEQFAQEYGTERRRLRVSKVRGSRFRGGYHDMEIKSGGIVVYPRLVVADETEAYEPGVISSGVPNLDQLLGGGLDWGSSVIVVGPAGAGKSTLATSFTLAAAQHGKRSMLFMFDERVSTFVLRAKGLGMEVGTHMASGMMQLAPLDPGLLSPGAFIEKVRDAVENSETRVIVIDSLNGYLTAMAEESAVLTQLHDLLMYLGGRGVLTLLTVAQHGVLGEELQSPLEASYLADTVIMLRYFEAAGRVRQAISVMKRRGGAHERLLREFRLGPGVIVGRPLHEFHGVLSGVPRFHGEEQTLMSAEND